MSVSGGGINGDEACFLGTVQRKLAFAVGSGERKAVRNNDSTDAFFSRVPDSVEVDIMVKNTVLAVHKCTMQKWQQKENNTFHATKIG